MWFTRRLPTITGFGERLSEQFPSASFDLVHARNSIDHTYDPTTVIVEALAVLRPGGYFYMNHYVSEGHAASYYGLHQWNFFVDEGKFLISGRYSRVIDVAERIKSLASVKAAFEDKDRITVVIRKHN